MAIIFKCVRWMNLLSSGNVFTEMDLCSHETTLIVGQNGAGKSTFIDAISFSLYGKPFRKINKPQLINSINGKGLLCEIEFSINQNEYKVRRGIKPTIFEIFQNGTLINQDAASRDYQDYLEKHILKLNHKSFTQIVTLGASTYVPFMQLPAHARREFNEDLLDIGIFSVMFGLLRDKIAENKSALMDVKYQIDLHDEKIEMQKKHIKSLEQNSQKLVDGKKLLIHNMRENVTELVNENEALQKTISELETTVEDETAVSKKSVTITQLEKQLDDKLRKLKADITFFSVNDTCPTCRQGIDHEFKCTTIDSKTESLTETEDALTKLEEEWNKVSLRLAEIKETKDRLIELYQTLNTNNSQIKFIEKQIASEEDQINSINSEDSSVRVEKKKLKELTELAAGYEALKEELVHDKATLDIASVLLKDGGIKAKIIKQYIPIMNKLINKYLAAMDFFVQFELDENFNEKIKSRYRDDFSYESFSEGEKCRIDLALMLCWRTISKIRNSNSTNLLVMDEIFDGSLDASGSEEFMKILQSLVKDTNIFIISHKTENISDKFERVVKFEKVKNFSRMVD